MRDKELERLASGVADERHNQSESKASEAGLLQAAHQRMRRLNRMTFKAHGVEFVRVPGDEKLRVRVSRDGGESTAEGDEAAAAGEDHDVDAMDALDPDAGEEVDGEEREAVF